MFRTLLAALTIVSLQTRLAHAVEVQVCTDHGPFRIDLFETEAPLHTRNFLDYVEEGFYNGTAFHRVVEGAIVQGGGFDRLLRRRAPGKTVANESANGLSNERGTVAAARTDDPDSAASQFFINLVDNARLDATSRSPGYTVFGLVIDGMAVVDAIGRLPTDAAGPLTRDVPTPLPIIESMTVVDPTPAQADTGDTPSPSPAPTASPTPPAQLVDSLAAARESGDAAVVLEAIGQLRGACSTIGPDALVAEAEAAFELGQVARAGYVLDEYFARAEPSTVDLRAAQALYRKLPLRDRAIIEPLIAHCTFPTLPDIPDGSVSDLDAMIEAQTNVRVFMESSDAFLDCLSEVIDEEALTDQQEVAAVGRHNETVELMENLAEDFNHQVRAFKARQD